MTPILLSVPHMGGNEQTYVRQAFTSNWLSTVGPNITAFEREFEDRIGLPAVALASGTAAIHLGLRLLGVGPGDEVFCPTLTFAASANPVRYLGAEPVFLDCDTRPGTSIRTCSPPPSAIAPVATGFPRPSSSLTSSASAADMDPILEACARYGIPVLEDAAEALGATYKGTPAGTLGHGRSLLLQRQQDHYHHRRRHARLPQPRTGSRKPVSGPPRPATAASPTSTPSSATTTA